MAELADAADSKSCGRPKRRLAKCSSFFVFQHIQLSAQNRPCGSVRSGTVLLWPDGYSLVTVELIVANMVRGARGGGLLILPAPCTLLFFSEIESEFVWHLVDPCVSVWASVRQLCDS